MSRLSICLAGWTFASYSPGDVGDVHPRDRPESHREHHGSYPEVINFLVVVVGVVPFLRPSFLAQEEHVGARHRRPSLTAATPLPPPAPGLGLRRARSKRETEGRSDGSYALTCPGSACCCCRANPSPTPERSWKRSCDFLCCTRYRYQVFFSLLFCVSGEGKSCCRWLLFDATALGGFFSDSISSSCTSEFIALPWAPRVMRDTGTHGGTFERSVIKPFRSVI